MHAKYWVYKLIFRFSCYRFLNNEHCLHLFTSFFFRSLLEVFNTISLRFSYESPMLNDYLLFKQQSLQVH